MERLGKKRLRFTDAERRQLAVLGKKLGRKALAEVATVATPDTILRWWGRAQRHEAAIPGDFPRRSRQDRLASDAELVGGASEGAPTTRGSDRAPRVGSHHSRR